MVWTMIPLSMRNTKCEIGLWLPNLFVCGIDNFLFKMEDGNSNHFFWCCLNVLLYNRRRVHIVFFSTVSLILFPVFQNPLYSLRTMDLTARISLVFNLECAESNSPCCRQGTSKGNTQVLIHRDKHCHNLRPNMFCKFIALMACKRTNTVFQILSGSTFFGFEHVENSADLDFIQWGN